MPKLNVTHRFVEEREPVLWIANSRFVAAERRGNGYSASSDRSTTAEASLADRILNAPPGTRFLLDSGFIPGNREVNPAIWNALLCHEIAFTNEVWQELGPWLNSPHANASFRDRIKAAITSISSSVNVLEDLEGDLAIAANYYVGLLSFRKSAIYLERRLFRNLHHRDPSNEELDAAVKSRVKRGLNLAVKGDRDSQKPNILTDEKLVVRAIIEAISRGRNVEILTSDADVLEQFFKATYLIDTHYRAYLLAENLFLQPLNFPEIDPSPAYLEEGLYETEGSKFLWRPFCAEDLFLPKDPTRVRITCTNLAPAGTGLHVTTIDFVASRESAEILHVKGRTGGRNTEKFGDRNFHLYTHPTGPGQAVSLLATDRGLRRDGIEWSSIDVEFALRGDERCDRYADAEIPLSAFTADGSDGLRLANLEPRVRLSFSTTPGWRQLHDRELSTAFRFFESRGQFFADESFLVDRIPSDALDVLGQRRVFTSSISEERAEARSSPGSLIRELRRRKKDSLRSWSFRISDGRYRAAFEHYVSLLAHKRALGLWIHSRLEERLRRPPSESEWQSSLAELNHWDRRVLRAKSSLSGTVWHEEDFLLVYAAMSAVFDGVPITVLTSRRTTFEQFVSLSTTISNDYVAWAASEQASSTLDIKGTDEHGMFSCLGFSNAVQIVPLDLCDGDGRWPRSEAETIQRIGKWLPNDAFPVDFGCWLFEEGRPGPSVFAGTFGLVRPMHELFAVKSRLDGRNSARFGENSAFANVGLIPFGADLWLVRRRKQSWGQKAFLLPIRFRSRYVASAPTPW